jgi:radical SAM protein with 4Fe4S-binding SPASM domain
MYHPERVAAWLQGEPIYPIYVEISPTSACNHRCIFCGLDFVGYKKQHLSWKMLSKTFRSMESCGVKSVMFAGEGEPLLHIDLGKMMASAFYHNLDCALTTNGVLLTETFVPPLLKYNKWIKVSVNAGSKETYKKIHRTKEDDFRIVFKNMEYAAKFRQSEGLDCTLGMQAILLKNNSHEMGILAEQARDIGMDYLVIKPYSHHLSSNHKSFGVTLPFWDDYAEYLSSFNTDNFHVIFRRNAFDGTDGERSYDECLALPFWAYISSEGDVWNCSAKMGNDDSFKLGNIYEDSFSAIWKQAVPTFKNIDKCRINCRMDACNRYLWELKHPKEHVNFI